MKHSEKSTIIPFPGCISTPVVPDQFTSECSEMILKAQGGPEDCALPAAFSIVSVKDASLEERNVLLEFQVELRYERFNQVLFFGLLNPAYSKGIALAVNPATGCVTDALNGMGVLGYLPPVPHGHGHAYCCSMRIHKFGDNFLCAVFIDGESIMYPAFSSESERDFQGIVGCDFDSGKEITYRSSQIAVERIAKVA